MVAAIGRRATLSHGIAYSNVWIARVDGASRRLSGWVVLFSGLATLLLSIFGGGALYSRLAGQLTSAPVLDRAVLYICVVVPLYAVAFAALAYERRASVPANADPAGALGIGFAVGLIGIGVAVGLSALLGAIAPGASAAPWAHRLAGAAIGIALIAFQAFGEEVFFRGWMQPILAARWGPWIGLAATSVLFAAAHAWGRPAGAVALVNDALAGMAFGLLAFRSGGLLAPLAAHFAWNWAEQCLFGLTPNPGVDALGSLLDLDLVGPGLLSGGRDELNGAVAATAALLLMIGLILAWRPGPRAVAASALQAKA
jgi:membrane protease YdiL (CAAX protease family)